MEIIKRSFNALRANVARLNLTITAVLIELFDYSIYNHEKLAGIQSNLYEYLQSQIRKSDLIFEYPNKCTWLIILTSSGEEEANIFVKRIFLDLQENSDLQLSVSIAEIANDNGTFKELNEVCLKALEKGRSRGPWNIEYVYKYKKRAQQEIKISILENDEIFSNVLLRKLENMDTENLRVEVKIFQDGYQFLQSDWYLSSHTHIIIMNDILPRQNGIDVLHKLRKMPNNKKYIIYMMTKRNSEEDMIYAYESGVDQYLVKPFNLRLFEVQIKRTLERLWL